MRAIKRLAPLTLGAAVAAVSIGLAAGPVQAETVADGPSVEQGSSTAANELTYSDEEVVAFFVLGAGKIYDENPELAESMGIPRQDVSKEDVEYVTNLFLSVDPDFHEGVTEAVQSGDPDKAQDGLDRLVSDAEAVREKLESENAQSGSESTEASAQAAKAAGGVYTTNYVAVANVAVGGTAAVVLVAAAAVGVVVVLYSPDATATDYEKDLLASNVAESLA